MLLNFCDSCTIKHRYISISGTHSGWDSEITATYVANDNNNVSSDPISRWLITLSLAEWEGRASRCSLRAILSERSSLISTKSSSWIRFTSFAGTGGRLLASINGEGLGQCSIGRVDGCVPMLTLHTGAIAYPADLAELVARCASGEALHKWAVRKGMLVNYDGSAPGNRGGKC